MIGRAGPNIPMNGNESVKNSRTSLIKCEKPIPPSYKPHEVKLKLQDTSFTYCAYREKQNQLLKLREEFNILKEDLYGKAGVNILMNVNGSVKNSHSSSLIKCEKRIPQPSKPNEINWEYQRMCLETCINMVKHEYNRLLEVKEMNDIMKQVIFYKTELIRLMKKNESLKNNLSSLVKCKSEIPILPKPNKVEQTVVSTSKQMVILQTKTPSSNVEGNKDTVKRMSNAKVYSDCKSVKCECINEKLKLQKPNEVEETLESPSKQFVVLWTKTPSSNVEGKKGTVKRILNKKIYNDNKLVKCEYINEKPILQKTNNVEEFLVSPSDQIVVLEVKRLSSKVQSKKETVQQISDGKICNDRKLAKCEYVNKILIQQKTNEVEETVVSPFKQIVVPETNTLSSKVEGKKKTVKRISKRKVCNDHKLVKCECINNKPILQKLNEVEQTEVYLIGKP